MDHNPAALNPWPRIDGWLLTYAPRVLKRLNPGASPEALHELEHACGMHLPPGLVQAYTAHDGAEEDASTVFAALRLPSIDACPELLRWLPVAAVVECIKFKSTVREIWHSHWLPIAEDVNGYTVVVDTLTGRVFLDDAEDGDQPTLAASLEKWFTTLADDMEAGRVDVLEEGAENDLQLLTKPRVPPLKPAPDPWAMGANFVQLLVEAEQLALAPGGDLRDLSRQVNDALETEGGTRRFAAVLAVFEEHAAVDELFCDDDHLRGLIEDFV